MSGHPCNPPSLLVASLCLILGTGVFEGFPKRFFRLFTITFLIYVSALLRFEGLTVFRDRAVVAKYISERRSLANAVCDELHISTRNAHNLVMELTTHAKYSFLTAGLRPRYAYWEARLSPWPSCVSILTCAPINFHERAIYLLLKWVSACCSVWTCYGRCACPPNHPALLFGSVHQ